MIRKETVCPDCLCHYTLGNLHVCPPLIKALMTMSKIPKCPRCKKPMKPQYDPIAKKITGYIWRCKYDHSNLVLSIG